MRCGCIDIRLLLCMPALPCAPQVLLSEMSGIDWGQIDAAGNALKAELLNEVVQVGQGMQREQGCMEESNQSGAQLIYCVHS